MIQKILYSVLLVIIAYTCRAQATINNFVHAGGYVTSPLGQLGEVRTFGTGPKKMILVPGWGFDWTIFKSFIESNQTRFTFYAITIPGFGTTHAPPMPAENENFKDLHWTKGVIKSIADLIEKEKLDHPDIMTCFTYSEVIALRLALDYPDKVGKVIIVSGMAKFTANFPSFEPRSLVDRVSYIEKVLAPRWFKNVSTETWNKGNFAAASFCRDSTKAKAHWNMMSAVPIPVMVRYLCEYYCTDISLEYQNLKVPVLVVLPSFSSKVLGDYNYLAPFFHFSWTGAMAASKMIHLVTVNDSNAFVMEDQPAKLNDLVREFVENGSSKIGPVK